MRTTILRQMIFIFVLPSVAGACAWISYSLSTTAIYNYEKVFFLLLAVIGTAVLSWLILGISAATALRLHQIPLTQIQHLRFFKPIIWGVLGGSAVASPVHASEVAVVASVENTTAPFFHDISSEPEASPFFPTINESGATSESTANVTLVRQTSATTSSAEPRIFFRENTTQAPVENHTEVPPHQHVVLQGETLWSIAEQNLPEGSTPAQILEKTYQIYNLNTDALESIDSFIYAGQILQIS